jgi:hypothetical protein
LARDGGARADDKQAAIRVRKDIQLQERANGSTRIVAPVVDQEHALRQRPASPDDKHGMHASSHKIGKVGVCDRVQSVVVVAPIVQASHDKVVKARLLRQLRSRIAAMFLHAEWEFRLAACLNQSRLRAVGLSRRIAETLTGYGGIRR